jgi:dipeptidase D
MNLSEQLNPKELWQFFDEICSIPRPSKKEKKIIKYLYDFAKRYRLSYKKDQAGNVLISKKASPGFEKKPVVVLQSHLDMVCEKNNNTVHDFVNDPIRPFIDNGWIKAKGTTLGADDGIGIASQLTILSSSDLQHGPLECLFTVDEETGLTGAYQLKPDFLSGKILLNLDSEDEGIIFIGCAGGIDTVGFLDVDITTRSNHLKCLKIEITGLQGGHSGDDINKGLGNSIKIIGRVITSLRKKYYVQIINLEGGNLRNAIPREAYAEIAIDKYLSDNILNFLEYEIEKIKKELKNTEKNIQFTISECRACKTMINEETSDNLLNIINMLPHGAISMSKIIPGLVETSTNLATVKRLDKKTFEIATSQRSSAKSSRDDIAAHITNVFHSCGATVKNSTGYPGWEPNPSSPILKKSVDSYVSLFGSKPSVTAIHAGLECGLFLEKYPDLDMISFGPTIKGAHSPDERLEIKSVEKYWSFLLELLKSI